MHAKALCQDLDQAGFLQLVFALRVFFGEEQPKNDASCPWRERPELGV